MCNNYVLQMVSCRDLCVCVCYIIAKLFVGLWTSPPYLFFKRNWGNSCCLKLVQCVSRGPWPVVIQSGIDLLIKRQSWDFLLYTIYIVAYHKTDLHNSIIALCLYLTCIFVQTRLCKIYLKFQ